MGFQHGAARTAGAAGAVLTFTGMAGLVWAGALKKDASYLSLLGATGEPTQLRFQLAVWTSALALAAVAVAVSTLLRTRPGRDRWRARAAAALATSAMFYALVADVPCTQGCPLPPYGRTLKAQDLAHATVAATAYLTGIVAMLLVWAATSDRFLRWLSVATAAVVAGAAATGALSALAEVQGAVGGELERLATAAGSCWLAATGCRLAFQRRSRRVYGPRHSARTGRPPAARVGARSPEAVPQAPASPADRARPVPSP